VSRSTFTDRPVYDRYALAVGSGIKGAAIIEEASTTLIVPPTALATVDRSGNLNDALNG
jgi:N-methylhydantoinase A